MANSDFKSSLREDFLRLEFKMGFNKLESKIDQTKYDLLKWVIGMFIFLSLMIIGLYFK